MVTITTQVKDQILKHLLQQGLKISHLKGLRRAKPELKLPGSTVGKIF